MPLKFVPWSGRLSKNEFDEGYHIEHKDTSFGYVSRAKGESIYEWMFNVHGPYGDRGKSKSLDAAKKQVTRRWNAWLKASGLQEAPPIVEIKAPRDPWQGLDRNGDVLRG